MEHSEPDYYLQAFVAFPGLLLSSLAAQMLHKFAEIENDSHRRG